MDKLSFLKRMAQLHPDDAEVLYWLSQEYATRGQKVEAIGQLSAALAICSEETLRKACLEGLASVTESLKQGAENRTATSSAIAEEQNLEGDEVDHTQNIRVDETNESMDKDQKENHEREITLNVTKDEEETSLQQQLYDRSVTGLKVLDGGKGSNSQISTKPVVTFDDVAGLKELKKTIHLRIISPFQNQSLFSRFRKKTGGGVLLYGPPGCGKTFITKATAGECRASFIPVHITDILDKYIGESERKLKDLFDKARHHKPSIMFFDEIDTIGFNRSKSSSNMRGVIDTFLTEMEGIDTNTDQVLVIGATNVPWDVDDALKRPGRFDRLVFVAPPDEEAREHMFRLKLEGRYSENINTKWLAERTEFFSGADIENLCERAAEHVLGEILETGVERPIQMEDFELLLQEIRPSTIEWLRRAKNYVKYANQSGIYNEVEHYIRKYGRQI